MNVVANTKFDEIGGLTNTLTLGDVVGETECKYINLIGPETKITELSERADTVFTTSTMATFVDAGLITFDEDEADVETLFLTKFGNCTLDTFIDEVMAPLLNSSVPEV